MLGNTDKALFILYGQYGHALAQKTLCPGAIKSKQFAKLYFIVPCYPDSHFVYLYAKEHGRKIMKLCISLYGS